MDFLQIFKCIWGHARINFSILNPRIFKFSSSVRKRPENTPKPKHPQTIPNQSQSFRCFQIFGPKIADLFDWFLMFICVFPSSGVRFGAFCFEYPDYILDFVSKIMLCQRNPGFFLRVHSVLLVLLKNQSIRHTEQNQRIRHTLKYGM